jgi:transcription initiation factor TFIIB
LVIVAPAFRDNNNIMMINEEIEEQKEDPPINRITCPICNKSNTAITDPESGEIICSNCGVVISERIEDDIHKEKSRAYTLEEADKKARTGAPASLARHDRGLYTIIGRDNKDASGQVLNPTMRSTIERLRAWDSRIQIHSPKDRNLNRAFQQLDRLKEKLGLSDAIIEKAAYIYRKVQERKLIRGRTIDGMLAASVYIACREMGTPRTVKDIATVSNVKYKNIARNYRILVFELGIKIPAVDPMKCIAKVANTLTLSEKTKHQALNIMGKVLKKEITAGKDPMGLAATVIYVSGLKTGEKIHQTTIAAASGVTEVTIRNRFKDLTRNLELN